MSQGAHTTRLLPTDRSGGVKHALFCLWYVVHSLPTSKTEPELHLAVKEGKLKRNLLLTVCMWLV